ncbi:MAG: flippase-like domain-containing protein [Haloferacaceae archaeon]
MSRSVAVSVVLPAYDEAATIEATVERTLATLGGFLPAGSYEVLVAEDGCSDRTPAIADRLAAADDRVRHVHSDERLGRGGALDRAFAAAAGDVLVYFDTDLATDLAHLEELVERVRSGDADVATGSRWHRDAEVDRPAKRGVPSLAYNALVRLFLRSSLRDHQCGFKALSREAFEALRHDVEDDHWFWDTELLVRAQRRGFRVAEFPVEWTPKGDSKVDLVRDVLGMGSQILRTWYQLSVEPRVTRRRSVVAGVAVAVVALALMTVYIDPSDALAALASADLAPVAAAAVVYVLSWPVRGARYRDILASMGHDDTVPFLTAAVFISQTGNLVFPARLGDGVRAYVMKVRRGVAYPTAFASLAAERLFDLLTLVALAAGVLVVLVTTGEGATVAAALSGRVPGVDPAAVRTAVRVAAGVGTVAVVALVALVLGSRTETSVARRALARLSADAYADRVAAAIERFAGDLQTVAGSPRAFVRVGATSLAVWSLDVVTAALVLYAFPSVDLAVPFLLAVAFFAVSVGNLAKVLPLSPGGVGLYEAAFTAFVVLLTPAGAVSAAVAFAASVLDHALKNAVTVAGGVASMLALNVSLSTAVDESGGPSPADADPAED